ncbi:rhamnan synthesis F family protein [Stappia sp.]|uniref:rhamnan synthesis F family protein n=1 Tax=Stappia sp. TaxID=1870903 RepID=UPI003D0B76BC
MKKISGFVYRFSASYWYMIKLLFIIYPIELYWRIKNRIDVRLYSFDRRLNRLTDGEIFYEGGRYAIFVVYTKLGLQPFTRTAIDALNKLGVNIVFVSNMKLSDTMREELAASGHLVVERENLGRDFGAYKDGIHLLRERDKNIERLILMNDSVFYFPEGLEDVFRKLVGPQPFIGFTEVFEHHYHVQSFLISFGREVIDHPQFLKYWREYRPISTRRWSIHKGEVGLTKMLVGKAGFQPTIIAHAAMLRERLEGVNFEELKASIDLLPVFFRDLLRRELYALMDRTVSQSPMARFSASMSIGTVGGRSEGVTLPLSCIDAEHGKTVTPPFLIEEMKSDLSRVKELVEGLSSFEKRAFVERFLDLIGQKNQVHLGDFFS